VSEGERIALIDRLRSMPTETEWLELKRNRHEPQELGEYLSALANAACLASQPRGYLVFGIDDATHDVVGTDFDPYSTKAKGNQDLFPLPDYDLSVPGQVAISLSGRILDERYTHLLMERTDLALGQVMLLDQVQKGRQIDREAHRRLKAAGLVEGRYPNLIVAGAIAKAAGDAGRHIRERGFDKRYYLDLILALVREHEPVDRKDVDQLLLTKLPERLSQEQKLRKVHNLLQELRRSGLIDNRGSRSRPQWVAVEPASTEDAR